ncbi:MAG: hypothetical protein AAF468_20615 [Pseudomonadota bacterium]
MPRGSATHSPGIGKLIDTLWFDVVQLSETEHSTEARKVPINVYMSKKFEGEGTRKATTSIWFTVKCEEPDVSEGGSDLDAILKVVRSKLDKHFKIEWERWLKVHVRQERIYDGTGKGLSLSWTEVQRGVTVDGDVLLRSFNGYGDWSSRWKIEPWPETFRDKNGSVLACIPCTDENEKALTVFAEKLVELRKALADFVAPENIEETLRQIASGQLLLSPTTSQEKE